MEAHGGRLIGTWRAFGRHMEGVWEAHGGCLGGTWRAFGRHMEGV